jgi:predicted nucleic acid-binding protein
VGLADALGPGPIGIDTAIVIYLIEERQDALPHILPLFEEADAGKRRLVTSALTLLEVLVVPFRRGQVQLADKYELLLTRSRGLQLVDLTLAQLRAAAQLRAVTGVKTPDALQLAAALSIGCRSFLTNDRRLPAIPGLKVVQLSSFLTLR